MKATLIDRMGSDLTVVNAARVSFNKESKHFDNKDEKLINYLANHNHWTPFSHCTITIREKVPIFVARQRFKHMVGFSYNEVSRRYVDDAPEFFTPDAWRSRPRDGIKQGSGPAFDLTQQLEFERMLEYHHNECIDYYTTLLKKGVAPEMARMVLPQSMYTEYYVTGSLYAWARAYNLRIDAHAQKEIQDLAKMWGKIIEPLYPFSWKALCSGSYI